MTTPRRVLVLAPTPFFGDRGCHVRILEECRAVAPLDIATEIVTYPTGGEVPDVTITRSPGLPGVEASDLGPSWSRPVLDTVLLGTAWRALRRFRPDLVHAHLHEGAAIATVLRALTGVPFLADLQGSLTEELIDHHALPRSGWLPALSRRVEAWLVNRPDAILVSSAAASSLVSSGALATPVFALPDGVDLARFRPLPRDPALVHRLGLHGKRVVVFLGVLTVYQGVDAVLDAVPRIVREAPDVHFLMLGYPNQAHYADLAASRGLAAVMSWPGRVPYEEAPRWLALGDVAVSLKSSLTEANGKLLNYMACGLPVVATDTPVNRELLGDTGAYVAVGDAAAAARTIIDLLQRPDDRRTMGAALRQRAEREFAWPVLGHRLAAIYQSVLGTASAHARVTTGS